jgi:signal transduction histidine kinase
MLSIQTKNRVDIIKQFTTDSFKIVANEGRLYQAILNILSNAIQAIDDKGSITISTALLENELVLTISDSGLGIPKENLSRIFDPFYTTKEPGKGTGLGLSISYEIIKEFNGSVEIQSEVKKGTNVIIKLPT